METILDAQVLGVYGDLGVAWADFGVMGEPVVLRKELALRLPQQGRVPRFVAEFLLARHAGEDALEAVQDDFQRYLPEPRERELWLHRLAREGSVRILDRLEVQVDLQSTTYPGRFATLDLACRVDPELADRHPGLLTGGLWGLSEVALGAEEPEVAAFWPVEVQVRLEPFLAGRRHFSAGKWIDLLLTSAGYDPDAVTEGLTPDRSLRRKLLLLARLAPFVEGSLHLLELGPKNTGKTYLARNLSPEAFVISGGRATPANLFVHLGTGRPGLLARRRVVAFDEVARLHLGGEETLAALKDFLESGRFSRGSREMASDASVVFLGNIEVSGGRPSPRYRHLLEPLPAELRDSAFADRIAAFLPGWELPKISRETLARGIGFLSDYFGAVLLKLRSLPYAEHYAAFTAGKDLLPGMTRRDQVAVERTARALLKLVFPEGPSGTDGEIVLAILSLAGELRQRVHEQLCILSPGEFSQREIGFSGVPRPEAPDLAPQAEAVRLFPGVYYLDGSEAPEDLGGSLRRIEATLAAAGRGPRLVGEGGAALQDALRIAWDVLFSRRRVLGVAAGSWEGKGLAVEVAGPVRDAGAAGLALLLGAYAVVRASTWSHLVVAAGRVSLEGRIEAPYDLDLRLEALRGVRRGSLVVGELPEAGLRRIKERLGPGWEVRCAGSVEEILGR